MPNACQQEDEGEEVIGREKKIGQRKMKEGIDVKVKGETHRQEKKLDTQAAHSMP